MFKNRLKLLQCEGVEYWHRVLREVVECPSLEKFRRELGMVLSTLL